MNKFDKKPISEFMNGLHKSSNKQDEKLFELIKSILEDTVGTGGHDYIPESLEFRISSLPYCRRKILFRKDAKRYLTDEEMIHLPIRSDEKELNESSVGQLIHETFQDGLHAKLGDKIKMEEEITLKVNDITLVGHYDLLIETDNGQSVVIDIKTTSSHQEYLPKQPHLTQLLAYQGVLGGIRGGILYVHRNNFQLSYFPQEFNKDGFSKLLIKLTELANAERESKLPPRISIPECGTEVWKCDYYRICYPEEFIQIDDFEVIEE